MTQWIDFKELRKQLRFSAVLRHYGVEVKVKGDQAQEYCPLPGHNGEKKSPSFSINIPKGIWQCFGCGAKGNVLDFAIRMEKLSPDNTADVRTVALRLQSIFNLGGVTTARPTTPKSSTPHKETLLYKEPPPQEKVVKVNAPLDFELKQLELNHPYLAERGFAADTVRHFGLGYCNKGLMAGRIVIPLHNKDGDRVGYAGRLVDDEGISEEHPKYKFPSARERDGVTYEFKKSHLLYNADKLRGKLDHLVVVEGFASVWWLHQAGITNAVALMGSSCSSEQADLILSVTKPSARISILPDADDAGVRCTTSLFALLGCQRWMRWIVLEDAIQPTDVPISALKKLVSGSM